MTNDFDRALERAALECALSSFDEAFWAENIPEPEYSRQFKHRMAKMRKSPAQYEKRCSRPLSRRIARTAAVTLAFLAVCSSLMAVPTVRAAAKRVVSRWIGTQTTYTYHGRPVAPALWYPTYLPEDYEQTARYDLFDHTSFVFRNETNSIWFSYFPAADGAQLSIDNTHSTYSEIVLDGVPAELYESIAQGYPSYLIWLSEYEGIAFSLEATTDTETLLKIAESIKPTE